jgi:hypothetical protein
MKRIAVVFIVAFVTAGALFAQELTYSGEMRTGFYIQQEKIGNLDPVAVGGMTNNDGDSGTGQGRLRMDLHFAYGILGMRVRFQIEPATIKDGGPYYPTWGFAYAYGNLFEDQLKISVGLLGESPWGTGGPRLRIEPEARTYPSYNSLSGDPYIASEGLMGIRLEYKPSFVPGLNVGFVLNQPDRTQGTTTEQSFTDMLQESVVGIAYEHDYFAVRIGYRFDSKIDNYALTPPVDEGARLTYRLEERVLGNYAEGMQVSLNGCYNGIGGALGELSQKIDGNTVTRKIGGGEYFINWLYWLWDTDNFTAQFDAGYALNKAYNNSEFKPIRREEYQSLEFRPGFYYKLFDNLLQVGLGGGFGMEFGPGKTYKSSSYQYYSIEPQVRLNIGSNGYIAAVYAYTDKYAWWDRSTNMSIPDGVQEGDKSVKHSVNIRAVYAF